ncbi:sodium:solute symporter [Halomarina halobia]|uniref:Sodium:solute symporter n=1 Tax=Halomarina halobia TaxID=3033386 RepID=A0ABD6AEI3_9EURY|nr:sodium:solute symporter family protein [Halomarina sp. PSR21]
MPSLWVTVGLVVTTIYLFFLIYLGYRGSQLTLDDVSDYFVAEGSISTLIIFLTGIGTALSSFTFLGSGGITYSLGIAGIVIIGAIVVTDIPAMIIVGEKFWKISKMGKDYVTPSDLLCDRFDDSKWLRVVVAIIAVGFSFFYIAIQFKGMGLVLNVLTDGFVSQDIGIAYVGVFMAIYIAIGGMRGVAYTDALQAILLFGGMTIVALWIIFTVPGNVYIQAAQQATKVTTIDGNLVNLYTVAAGFGLSLPVWPHMWERYFAAKRHSGVWGLGFAEGIGDTFLLTLFAGLIGFAGIATFTGLEGAQADTVILRFIQQMPGPMLGIMMAAAIAAAMSTADSIILMVGSIFSRDIYQVLLAGDVSEERLSTYSKGVSGLIALGALLVATRPLGELIQLVLDMSFPGYFLLLPVAVAAFWWPRANKYGAVAGLVSGVATLVYLLWSGISVWDMWVGFPAAVVQIAVMVPVTYLTPEPPADRVQEFVHDVRAADPERLEGGVGHHRTPVND